MRFYDWETDTLLKKKGLNLFNNLHYMCRVTTERSTRNPDSDPYLSFCMPL